ncbi:TPA: hypothetical protein HA318_03175 [Candidatus Micrarchaeota archaeon]|nr:MAG: hypothetical protein AUJ65_04155 [Candidatus Micrarchaeota archaeon CG1_02_51_15]HII38980.1 hypothetical protein [Candidatus Micrarchaeota archaeon]
MEKQGIVPSIHPVNFDLVNGKPFFFEIEEINRKKVKKAVETAFKTKAIGQSERDRLLKLIDAYRKSVKTPSQI